KGYRVDIFERRPDMRTGKVSGGRSINLALSARGIYSLEEVGLYDEIKKISIPMYGRMVHLPAGELYFQRYGKDDSEYINAVSRAGLNRSLINLAEKDKNINFYFNYRCDGFNFIDGELKLFNEDTFEHSWLERNSVIAADGAFSAVRNEMLKHTRFNYNQEFENYGYKELTIPPGIDNSFLLEKNALHIWPRGSFMLIALPNIDGSFTCTLFLAHEFSLGGSNSFEFLKDERKVLEFLSRNFPDAFNLMTGPAEEFFQNPTGNLVTVKCYPWSFEDKVVLLGDSAHAIVPFFGQGMNAAFEDCSCLNDLIGKHKDDWKTVFDEFQKQRKANTDAIADLARENFIEMRDLVATQRFQLKKKIEAELQKKYPKKFIPKYSMVTFMRIPYSEAMNRGKAQDDILDALTEKISNIDKADWDLAKSLIQKKL
ncbi:MAG: FAD-dependent oxidoreductase, partial [Ignavibacteria bacterium]